MMLRSSGSYDNDTMFISQLADIIQQLSDLCSGGGNHDATLQQQPCHDHMTAVRP